MTEREEKIIQIVCDQLCKIEKCEACPLESFFDEENKRTEEKRKKVAKVCKNCENFRTSGCGAFTLSHEFGSCNFYREAMRNDGL